MVSHQSNQLEFSNTNKESDPIFTVRAIADLVRFCEESGFKCTVSSRGSQGPSEIFAGRSYSESLTVTFDDGVELSLIASHERANWARAPGVSRFSRDFNFEFEYKPHGIDVTYDDQPFSDLLPSGDENYNMRQASRKFRQLVAVLGHAEYF